MVSANWPRLDGFVREYQNATSPCRAPWGKRHYRTDWAPDLERSHGNGCSEEDDREEVDRHEDDRQKVDPIAQEGDRQDRQALDEDQKEHGQEERQQEVSWPRLVASRTDDPWPTVHF